MSGEVKIYRVTGYMLINHDKLPTWQKFAQEVTALSEKDALEKVYSLLGSRHKLKRYHIRVTEVRTITPEEATKPEIHRLLKVERLVR
ncbi:MAG: 50S ribosomal protein L18Ae [Desulfurococcaceae archaeon]